MKLKQILYFDNSPEPPTNYLWVKDGNRVYRHNGTEWVYYMDLLEGGTQELWDAINEIKMELGENSQFLGVADESTELVDIDGKGFYLAGPGQYGDFTVPEGSLAVLNYNDGWEIKPLYESVSKPEEYTANNFISFDETGGLKDSNWTVYKMECRLQELEYSDETLIAPKTSTEQETIIKECCKNGNATQIILSGVVTQADHDAGRMTNYPVGYCVSFPIVSGMYDTRYNKFKYTVNAPILSLNSPGGTGRNTVRSFTFIEDL